MLILYSTLGCHLCEQALSMLKPMLEECQIEIVDISDDDHLMEKYGIRIPVIQHRETRQEIAWPFSESELHKWLKNS